MILAQRNSRGTWLCVKVKKGSLRGHKFYVEAFQDVHHSSIMINTWGTSFPTGHPRNCKLEGQRLSLQYTQPLDFYVFFAEFCFEVAQGLLSQNHPLGWRLYVTNPVSFVFYSIWCHLVALLLWLTTAPSFPSSLLFCCIFPLYYFPLSCFSWCLFCPVPIWFCPYFPRSKRWFNAPFISVTPPSQLCFLCSRILSLVQMFPLFLPQE